MLHLNKNLNFMKYSISISVPKDTGQSSKDTGQAPSRMGLAPPLPHTLDRATNKKTKITKIFGEIN